MNLFQALPGKIVNLINAHDPGRDAFVTALESTLAATFGGLFWLYTQLPLTYAIILIPGLIILNVIDISISRKISLILLACILVGAVMFLQAVLISYPFFLILSYFVFIVIAYHAPAFKYAKYIVLVFMTMGLGNPSGWAAGLERICECAVAFLITSSVIFFISILTDKYRTRKILENISAASSDTFLMAVSDFPDSINPDSEFINRSLQNNDIFHSLDFSLSDAYEDKSHSLHHILLKFLKKGDQIVNLENSEIRFDNIFYKWAADVYQAYRRIYRDINFLLSCKESFVKAESILPDTNSILKITGGKLFKLHISIRQNLNMEIKTSDESAISDWKEKLRNTKYAKSAIDTQISEFLYGVRCLVNDIETLQKIVNSRRRE